MSRRTAPSDCGKERGIAQRRRRAILKASTSHLEPPVPQNSDVLHEVLTTILHAYRSPGHAFGSGHKPDSWASYGDLTQKLLGLIARAGELPASVEDLDENDQGKLKATLSNELQLAEEHAKAVIHAQCKFMQAVAQAAVDAVEEVSDVLNDKDATIESDSDGPAQDAPQAGTPTASEGDHGVPEAQDAPAAPSDPTNPPAPNNDLKPIAAPPPETYTWGPEVLPEPAPHAEDAPAADAPPPSEQPGPTKSTTLPDDEANGDKADEDLPSDEVAPAEEETDSPSAPEPSEADLAGIPPVGPGFDSPSEAPVNPSTAGEDGSTPAPDAPAADTEQDKRL